MDTIIIENLMNDLACNRSLHEIQFCVLAVAQIDAVLPKLLYWHVKEITLTQYKIYTLFFSFKGSYCMLATDMEDLNVLYK